MIHLWTIDSKDNLELNVTELLKYPLLAAVYQKDISNGKTLSKEYFKYLDHLTSTSGYCIKNGLNDKDAHLYAYNQTRLTKDYVFPPNNKAIIKWVTEELEYDIIGSLVNTAVQALNASAKSLKYYVKTLNNLEEADFKDADGNPIDVSTIVNKVIKTVADIPSSIDKLKVLIEQQTNNSKVTRGSNGYKSSMDGDGDVERYHVDED